MYTLWSIKVICSKTWKIILFVATAKLLLYNIPADSQAGPTGDPKKELIRIGCQIIGDISKVLKFTSSSAFFAFCILK